MVNLILILWHRTDNRLNQDFVMGSFLKKLKIKGVWLQKSTGGLPCESIAQIRSPFLTN